MLCKVLACLFTILSFTLAEAGIVPNPDFDRGDKSPDGWRLSGGAGRWVDHSILEVTGTGHDANDWHTDAGRFTPGGLYHFQMRARRTSGSGCTVSGPTFANRDYASLSSDWRWYGHVFRAPDRPDGHRVRVGQWEAKGSVQFDAVRVMPVIPIYKSLGRILLGEGESIDGGRYVFRGTFDHEGSNFHRTLANATAGFNSNRWCFGANQQVTYRLAVAGHPFQSGQVSFDVNYHTRGECVAEVRRDQKQWLSLATKDAVGTVEASLPAKLFPADVLWVRLRSTAAPCNFQVNQIEVKAALDGRPPQGRGRTLFADIPSLDVAQAIQGITLDETAGSGQVALRVTVRNPGAKAVTAVLGATIGQAGSRASVLTPRKIEVPGNGTATFSVDIPGQKPGKNQVELDVHVPGLPPLQTTLTLTVPDYYRADYGQLIGGAAGPAAVWWCDATHKVPRNRPLPTVSAPAAQMAAARNDHEAVQVIVRPSKPLVGLTAAAGALTGPKGATIPAANVKVLRVFYHFVDHPTDEPGARLVARRPAAAPETARRGGRPESAAVGVGLCAQGRPGRRLSRFVVAQGRRLVGRGAAPTARVELRAAAAKPPGDRVRPEPGHGLSLSQPEGGGRQAQGARHVLAIVRRTSHQHLRSHAPGPDPRAFPAQGQPAPRGARFHGL